MLEIFSGVERQYRAESGDIWDCLGFPFIVLDLIYNYIVLKEIILRNKVIDQEMCIQYVNEEKNLLSEANCLQQN